MVSLSGWHDLESHGNSINERLYQADLWDYGGCLDFLTDMRKPLQKWTAPFAGAC